MWTLASLALNLPPSWKNPLKHVTFSCDLLIYDVSCLFEAAEKIHILYKNQTQDTIPKKTKTMSGLSNHSLLKWNKVITTAKSWIHLKTQHWIYSILNLSKIVSYSIENQLCHVMQKIFMILYVWIGCFGEPFGSAFGKNCPSSAFLEGAWQGLSTMKVKARSSLYLFVMFGAGTIAEIRMKYILKLSIQIFNPSNY